MEELKEKLLCVLTNNAGSIHVSHGYYEFTVNACEIIRMYSDPSYPTKEIKKKFLFLKWIKIEYLETTWKYYIRFGDSIIKISKEEYDNILNLRKEKIKERQLEELNKLCNK